MTDSVYEHDRVVPPAWQADLDRISREGELVSWLKLAWYPGMTYEPVQRWVVYEMAPIQKHHYTDMPEIMEDLAGEDPNLRGKWIKDDSVPQKLGGKRWVSNSFVSQTQWKLFRETRHVPNLTWIIQGDKGGHPWRLSQAELGWFEEHQIKEPDIPNPGDLPYADYDDRVAKALAEKNKLLRWRRALPWHKRGFDKTEAGIIVRRERKEIEEEYNRRMSAWIDNLVESAVSNLSRKNLPQPSDFVGEPERLDEEAIEEDFITSTATRV